MFSFHVFRSDGLLFVPLWAMFRLSFFWNRIFYVFSLAGDLVYKYIFDVGCQSVSAASLQMLIYTYFPALDTCFMLKCFARGIIICCLCFVYSPACYIQLFQKTFLGRTANGSSKGNCTIERDWGFHVYYAKQWFRIIWYNSVIY